jgi:hypothetical protein
MGFIPFLNRRQSLRRASTLLHRLSKSVDARLRLAELFC